MTENDYFSPDQSGFLRLRSTVTSSLKSTDDWYKGLDLGKLLGLVFIDLKKAFDTVDHDILCKKLENYAFVGTFNFLIILSASSDVLFLLEALLARSSSFFITRIASGSDEEYFSYTSLSSSTLSPFSLQTVGCDNCFFFADGATSYLYCKYSSTNLPNYTCPCR